MTQKEIRSTAIAFAKKHKNAIAKELTDTSIYHPSKTPVSIFMAGSPGAGKTEFSQRLTESLETQKIKAFRLDADELREYFPHYNGENSHLFQGAVSLLVDRILDELYKNRQHFILDGTFSHQEIAEKNIKRSLKHKRTIGIAYMYLDPKVAWAFTQAREKIEGRRILKKDFIHQFFESQNCINSIHEKYPEKVLINLIEKDLHPRKIRKIHTMENKRKIDDYIPKLYTQSTLKKQL